MLSPGINPHQGASASFYNKNISITDMGGGGGGERDKTLKANKRKLNKVFIYNQNKTKHYAHNNHQQK